MFVLIWLIGGIALGGLYAGYAHSRGRSAKRVLGVGLLVAALIYVAFVMRSVEPLFWAGVEIAGAVVFGLMGLAGVRGGSWWLVAGWGLHPVWDVGLHYFGPASQFAPEWYTLGCVGFDLVVAAYAAHSAAELRSSKRYT